MTPPMRVEASSPPRWSPRRLSRRSGTKTETDRRGFFFALVEL